VLRNETGYAAAPEGRGVRKASGHPRASRMVAFSQQSVGMVGPGLKRFLALAGRNLEGEGLPLKAALYHGRRDVRIQEVEEPVPEPGQVKIEVRWCGICGSDLHEYRAGPVFIPREDPHPLTGQTLPVILGHEFSGQVFETGGGVTRVVPGDRVVVEPILRCGVCRWCRRGQYNLCAKSGFLGLSGGGGGFAHYVVVPEEYVHPLPGNLDFEKAALAEPLAVALHAVRRGQLRAGERVSIFGAGPIGLAVLLAAKAAGASQVIVSEVVMARREKAAALGADTTIDPRKESVPRVIRQVTRGAGVNVAFETSGTPGGLGDALRSLDKGGRVVVVSLWEDRIQVDFNRLVIPEREIIGSLGYCGEFPAVLALMADGRLDPYPLITRRIDLVDLVAGGFERLVQNPKEVKILVQPG